jgi:hypothetical protein
MLLRDGTGNDEGTTGGVVRCKTAFDLAQAAS